MKKLARFMASIMMASGLVAGCRVGPNYHRPTVQPPAAFRDLSENPQVQAQAASYADLPWWQVFQDPQLQELIRTALKQNYDLQLATERINAARAQVAISRSRLFPQVQGNGDFSGGKEHNFQTKSNFLTLTADAAFQLDFFGRLRRATEASRADLLATEDARQTVILTLVSDVASDYFALLQLDLQHQITHETVNTQIDSVKLTRLRLEHGVATKLDVLQAQQVLDSANAQIPERRPDIREAEQVLVAANAEIGVAKAQFFPQISLTGSGGGSFGRSNAFSSLMSSQLGIWSYGAQVSQPIFTGGALRGNLRVAKSQHQQALISYRQTIQRAFSDVSDALIGYEKFHQVRVRQEDTVADLQESVHLSTMRYKGGTTTYLEVLDGQRSLFSAELTLAEARGTEYQSLVQLYRALGGGWQQQP